MSEESLKKQENKSDEIDLVEIVKTIWAGRKTIYKSVGICIILGIIIVLGTPNEYKSEAKLLIETGSGVSGMAGLLQQFGGLAGLNIAANKGEDALIPQLYPDIVNSTPFLLELLDQKIHCSYIDSTITLSEFLKTKTRPSFIGMVTNYTIGLPVILINCIKNNKVESVQAIRNTNSGPLKLTMVQNKQIMAVSGMIHVEQNEKTGVLFVSVETQDPIASADLEYNIVNLLATYITDYRIQKAKVDLQFVEDRHREAEQRYKNAQINLAYFKDQNKNIILASAQTMEQNLQAEYNLAFNIYNTLSQQLEQSKMKVQEKTPVFKVMNPVEVPLIKDKPKISLILMAMIFLGGFVGVGIIFSKMLKSHFFK
jgi:uncharacterized protein involved in exopolysaccharide biosynthesis